jgi:RecA/RadA recombinase
MGVGGVPRGRITEIYGTESSGKTTLALQIIAEAQKRGGHLRSSWTPNTPSTPNTPVQSASMSIGCISRSRPQATRRWRLWTR